VKAETPSRAIMGALAAVEIRRDCLAAVRMVADRIKRRGPWAQAGATGPAITQAAGIMARFSDLVNTCQHPEHPPARNAAWFVCGELLTLGSELQALREDWTDPDRREAVLRGCESVEGLLRNWAAHDLGLAPREAF
jgi:hypothetical protein